MLKMPNVLLAVCVFPFVACSGVAAIAGPLSAGVWGGQQGNLTVYADSATLDMPCAAGRLQSPLVAANDGTFDVNGLYAVQAGPMRVGGPDWQSARYHGTRDDEQLTLTITLSSAGTIGPLQFRRGTTGQFARCL